MCISRACSRAKTTETGFIQNCAVRRRRRSARLNGPRRHAISNVSAAVPWMLVPWKLGPWKLGPPTEGGCAHLARPNGSGRPQLHQAHLPLGRSRQTPTSAMESTVEWALPQGIWPRQSTVRSHTHKAAVSERNAHAHECNLKIRAQKVKCFRPMALLHTSAPSRRPTAKTRRPE